MAVHYHRPDEFTEETLAANPLRIELYGRRFIRNRGQWRVFVGKNQTHNHRPVSAADAAYLEQRFPTRRGTRAA